jgi:flagellar biosynthesis/type III secretory pathway M-ring protein FliF/YscJ
MEPITSTQLNQALQTIAEKTNSELIRFFVIMAVVVLAFIGVMAMLYPKIMKNTNARQAADNKADQQKLDGYIKREALIIDVVKQNTEAITSLKSVLDINTRHCDTCKADQISRIGELGTKIDANTLILSKISILQENKGGNVL